jgi:hypothetical protein
MVATQCFQSSEVGENRLGTIDKRSDANTGEDKALGKEVVFGVTSRTFFSQTIVEKLETNKFIPAVKFFNSST